MGWTTPGQWFNYTVNAATAGTYTVSFRVASPYGITDALHIANAAGANLSGSVAVPNTGGYQTWTTVTASVTLPAGQQTLTVDQDTNGWNLHYLSFASTGGGGTAPSGDQPFGGTAAAVPGTALRGQLRHRRPGRRLQRHLGQRLRQQLPLGRGRPRGHLRRVAHQAGGNGYDLGWTATGQWFNYTVNVATAGTYALSLRLAAPTAVTNALQINNAAGTDLSGVITAPATGGYQDWTTVTENITLPAGVQTLTVYQDSPGWNLHYLTFATSGGSGTGPAPTAGSRPGSGATPAASRARRARSSSTSSTPPTASTPTARSTGASTASPSRSRSRRTTR